MTEPRKLRVFLCHASQDKPIVRELYQRLLAEGWIDPWLDEERLLPGQNWHMEIDRALENTDLVLVGLSKRWVNKKGYIQKEIKKVMNVFSELPDEQLFIVPVRLDNCEVPISINSWQWVDYFGDNKERNYKLLYATLSGAYQKLLLLGNKNQSRIRTKNKTSNILIKSQREIEQEENQKEAVKEFLYRLEEEDKKREEEQRRIFEETKIREELANLAKVEDEKRKKELNYVKEEKNEKEEENLKLRVEIAKQQFLQIEEKNKELRYLSSVLGGLSGIVMVIPFFGLLFLPNIFWFLILLIPFFGGGVAGIIFSYKFSDDYNEILGFTSAIPIYTAILIFVRIGLVDLPIEINIAFWLTVFIGFLYIFPMSLLGSFLGMLIIRKFKS
jgi:hypothetical protein